MPRKSKKSTKKLDIFKANRFDPNALAANRAGTLAASQKTRLTVRLVSMAFSSIASVAFGILWFYLAVIAMPKQTIVNHWLALIIAVLSFLLGVIWIVDGARNLVKDSFSLLRDILGGEVVVAEAPRVRSTTITIMPVCGTGYSIASGSFLLIGAPSISKHSKARTFMRSTGSVSSSLKKDTPR
jgi:hypothetical protein